MTCVSKPSKNFRKMKREKNEEEPDPIITPFFFIISALRNYTFLVVKCFTIIIPLFI